MGYHTRHPFIALAVLVVGVAGWLSTATAAEPDYRIGTDDILNISVWDQKELDQIVTVRPDGKISLPLVGDIQAAGQTVAELSASLSTAYSRTVRGAEVTVSIREIRSRPVFLVGNVVRPGPMQLTHEMTVLQALAAAGGPIPNADLESAFVLRGEKRIPVNLHKMLQQGDTGQNLKLQPRDTLVVPNASAVYIQGEVKTPGQLKYSRDMTIATAIAAAGGFTPMAAPKRVTVTRDADGKRQVFRVNVSEILSDPAESKDLPLKPNDIVVVPQRLF
jgi:polysaccharide biosynthesis/export protein